MRSSDEHFVTRCHLTTEVLARRRSNVVTVLTDQHYLLSVRDTDCDIQGLLCHKKIQMVT